MTLANRSNGIFVAALPFSLGLMVPGQTVAQTAKNLVCKGCVNGKDIGKNAVGTGKIKNNTIRAKDLHTTAKPAGADAVETLTDTNLSPTSADVVILSVTVTAPGPGTIIATASLYVDFNGILGRFACTLATDSSIGGHYTSGENGDGAMPASRTRAFPVAAAGNMTINVVCREVTGDITLINPNLTAWFVPGKY